MNGYKVASLVLVPIAAASFVSFPQLAEAASSQTMTHLVLTINNKQVVIERSALFSDKQIKNLVYDQNYKLRSGVSISGVRLSNYQFYKMKDLQTKLKETTHLDTAIQKLQDGCSPISNSETANYVTPTFHSNGDVSYKPYVDTVPLKVVDAKASNGLIQLNFNKKIEQFLPERFYITQKINGQMSTIMPQKIELSEDHLSVNLTVPKVEASNAKQTVETEVRYNDQTIQAKPFTIQNNAPNVKVLLNDQEWVDSNFITNQQNPKIFVLADSDTEVTVRLNGTVQLPNNGYYTLGLRSGLNQVQISAKKNGVQAEDIFYSIDYGPNSSSLIQNVSLPPETNNSYLLVSGTTQLGNQIYINGERIAIDVDGTFKKGLTLNEGDNAITIKAIDRYGNSEEITKTVKLTRDLVVSSIQKVTENAIIVDLKQPLPSNYMDLLKEYSVDGTKQPIKTIRELADGTFELQIDSLANKQGTVTIADKTASFDFKAPKISGNAEIKDSGTIEVSFDEPIESIGKIKLMNGTVEVPSTQYSYQLVGNLITITLNQPLKTGSYTVVAEDVKDQAGNNTPSSTATFSTSSPIITAASYNEETNVFTLNFDQSVTIENLAGIKINDDYLPDELTLQTVISGTPSNLNVPSNKWEFTLSDRNALEKSINNKTNLKLYMDKDAVKANNADKTGNFESTYSSGFPLSYTADITKPSIKNVKFEYKKATDGGENSVLTLTFNEKATINGTVNIATAATGDPNEVALNLSDKTTDENNQIILNATELTPNVINKIKAQYESGNGKAPKVFFKNDIITDSNDLKNDEVTFNSGITLTYMDSVPPTFTGVEALANTKATPDTITLTFSEPIANNAFAQNETNYTINVGDTTLPKNADIQGSIANATAATPYFVKSVSGNTITIELNPKFANLMNNDNVSVMVKDLSDLYGLKLAGDAKQDIKATAASAAVSTPATATLVDPRTVKLKFTNGVLASTVDSGDFIVTDHTINQVTVNDDPAYGDEVTITLNEDATSKVTIKPFSTFAMKDDMGNVLETGVLGTNGVTTAESGAADMTNKPIIAMKAGDPAPGKTEVSKPKTTWDSGIVKAYASAATNQSIPRPMAGTLRNSTLFPSANEITNGAVELVAAPGQYVTVIGVDASNKIVAYYSTQFTASQIAAPNLAGVSAADVTGGENDGKTKITLPSLPAGATKFMYKNAENTTDISRLSLAATLTNGTDGWFDMPSNAIISQTDGYKIAIAAVASDGSVVQFTNVAAVAKNATAASVTAKSVAVTSTDMTGKTAQLEVQIDGTDASHTYVLNLSSISGISSLTDLISKMNGATNSTGTTLSTVADITSTPDNKMVITSKSKGTSSLVSIKITGNDAALGSTLTGFDNISAQKAAGAN